ncbi:MAG: oxidoreductase [Alphaproteobacteria bacterium]|nr:oxidoreductase [Alphaproteobacteria bacterium]
MFKALLLTRHDDKSVTTAVEELAEERLPAGDVLVDIDYSTINYKDGLIIHNKAPLVRNFPHIPGVDFAGRVTESEHPEFKKGDPVVLTGWGVGERHWGGLAERARVKGDWLVKVPEGWTTRHTMAIGTAGFTSMLAVMDLEDHGMAPENGEVLVTGGAGGVGSIATALLAKRGYEVTASTGRPETHDYLRSLGASQFVDRAELAEASGKPMESVRFQACIDAVGGSTLARVLGQLKPQGALAAVGNAGGNDFNANVIPFLLRGIKLLGIDSVYQPKPRREAAWKRLAEDLDLELLESTIQEIGLADVPEQAASVLRGQVRGRTVVNVRN